MRGHWGHRRGHGVPWRVLIEDMGRDTDGHSKGMGGTCGGLTSVHILHLHLQVEIVTLVVLVGDLGIVDGHHCHCPLARALSFHREVLVELGLQEEGTLGRDRDISWEGHGRNGASWAMEACGNMEGCRRDKDIPGQGGDNSTARQKGDRDIEGYGGHKEIRGHGGT